MGSGGLRRGERRRRVACRARRWVRDAPGAVTGTVPAGALTAHRLEGSGGTRAIWQFRGRVREEGQRGEGVGARGTHVGAEIQGLLLVVLIAHVEHPELLRLSRGGDGLARDTRPLGLRCLLGKVGVDVGPRGLAGLTVGSDLVGCFDLLARHLALLGPDSALLLSPQT